MRPAPSDTVPAMLTPGEAVLNKEAAELVGRDKIKQINKMGMHMRKAQGYADGDPNVQPATSSATSRLAGMKGYSASGPAERVTGPVTANDYMQRDAKPIAATTPVGASYRDRAVAQGLMADTTPALEPVVNQPVGMRLGQPQLMQPQVDLLGEYKSAVGLANGTEMVQGYAVGGLVPFPDETGMNKAIQRYVLNENMPTGMGRNATRHIGNAGFSAPDVSAAISPLPPKGDQTLPTRAGRGSGGAGFSLPPITTGVGRGGVQARSISQQPATQGMKPFTPVVHAADLPSQQLAALTPVPETKPTQQAVQTPQPQPAALAAPAPQAEEQLTGNRVIPAGMRLTSYGAVTPINNPLAYEAERRIAARDSAAQMAPINALIQQAMNPSADDGTFTGMGRAKRQARGARAALSELTGMQKAQMGAEAASADRAANREVTMRGQDITAANAAESNKRQLIGDLISRDLGMQRLNVDTDRIKAIRERLAQEQAMADTEQERQMLEGQAAGDAFAAANKPWWGDLSEEDQAIVNALRVSKNPTQYITARAK